MTKLIKMTRRDEKDIERAGEIDVSLGSLAEFQELKGCAYEIIDIEGNEKFLRAGGHLQNLLFKAIDVGADAIIRYSHIPYYGGQDHVGIPVRRVD